MAKKKTAGPAPVYVLKGSDPVVLADALHDTTMHLTCHQDRVNDLAKVIDDRIGDNVGIAGIGVNFICNRANPFSQNTA